MGTTESMVGEFLDSVWGLSMLEQHRRLVDAHTTDVTTRLEASLWGCHEVSEIALVVDHLLILHVHCP